MKLVSVFLLLIGTLLCSELHSSEHAHCKMHGNSKESEKPLFDSSMAHECKEGCSFHGKVDDEIVVNQPGAKVGDLVRCPVSGAVFKVKSDSPHIVDNGKSYYTCCGTCAGKFNQKQKTSGNI